MKLAKKYTHYLARTDTAEPITPCTSLEEAEDRAVTKWDLAEYYDKPEYDICDRNGNTVAMMWNGKIKDAS